MLICQIITLLEKRNWEGSGSHSITWAEVKMIIERKIEMLFLERKKKESQTEKQELLTPYNDEECQQMRLSSAPNRQNYLMFHALT